MTVKLIALLFGGGSLLAIAAGFFLREWAKERARADLGQERLKEQEDVNQIHNRIDSDAAYRERVRRQFDGP